MEKAAIYPYSESYEPFVRHQQLIHKMKVESLISPIGWGLKDDCVKTNKGKLKVTDDFNSGIEKCSAVWFVDDAYISLSEEIIKKRLFEALQQDKKIIFTRDSGSEFNKKIRKIIPSGREIVIGAKKYDFIKDDRKVYYDINTPVIFILGITENTDKFEVQVGLREQLIKKGYVVSSVSTRSDSTILGMHDFPNFMFDVCISETDKILSYNHFVKKIEWDENPEVIIIGIPGGVFPISKIKPNYFGITAFEISSALTCDYAVLCSSYLDYSKDLNYFSKISNGISEKLGFIIDYHHIAARTYDKLLELPIDVSSSWLTLDESFIERKVRSYNINNVYNLRSYSAIERLADSIIEKLSEEQKLKLI